MYVLLQEKVEVVASNIIDKTLQERGSNYGTFKSHSAVVQEFKRILNRYPNLSDSQRESLDMIVHKIGRILNGNPNYADSWLDIAGYAQLIYKELEEVNVSTT